MSRGRWVVLIAVAAVGIVVTLGWLLFRDTTTPVGAGVVQGQFSGEAGTAPGDPGVYRYRTSGFEEIDALGGARHEYPQETFMTVSVGTCGPSVRWDALAERRIVWSHCGPDLAITDTLEYHEWFGIPDEEAEHCIAPRPVFTMAESIVCVSATSTETYRVEVIGPESLVVDGNPVATVHIRRSSTLSDGSTGDTVVDVWRLGGTPLVVRMELRSTSVTESAIGDVTYTEEFVLELLGLTPTG